jgi:hypothetical protein
MPKGGRRENAGRPPGRKNNDTLAKEKATQEAIDTVTKDLTPAEIEKLTPLAVILMAMRAEVTAGDLRAAASIGEKALAYMHARKAAELPQSLGLPWELRPDGPNGDDPPPTPDEPGPVGPARQYGLADPAAVPDEPGPANPVR